MRLSTKSRYAVTSLLDLVMHSDEGPVSLADISIRQGISLSYLEQLFAKMRRNKLVVSTRGPGGGYSLGDSPEQVCIADVINAVDEEMQVADKDISNGSPTYEPCLTEQLWEELSAEIENYLTTISLADMMRNDEVQALSRAHDLRQQRQSLI
ncbi:MAG: Rrf2 family transcriptional regulator [Gammaproteobacteria bacterium]|nr:Rrf2 family transcriptional regulator [Gammaproteobacteria bacterium]MBT8437234.1 Rrf2 family transcriptional regulator [Gammaproteobacteria bacterium]